MDVAQVRSDFDRIAELSRSLPDRAGAYERWLLDRLPRRLERALDVGCGLGFLARQLALRSDAVLAIDLSQTMIEVAQSRSREFPNIEYRLADVLEMDLQRESFDCIVSVNTLHHLPLEQAVPRLCHALRPGGVLGIVDVIRFGGVGDILPGIVATLLNRVSKAAISPQLRQAWDDHWRTDTPLTAAEARRAWARILPSARFGRHLRWRYSVLWHK